MKKYIYRMSWDDLYTLCNKNNWFTGGTSEQYDMMAQALDNGASVEDLATMIWLCSSGEDGKPLNRSDIVETLNEQQAWPISVDHVVDTLRRDGFGETEVEVIREALTTHPDAGKAYKII